MRKISKAVITMAGKGKRLLPYTKETPKEMLPVYVKSNGGYVLKPISQLIFESIFDVGIRDFCFIVGRSKRSVEDHFLYDGKDKVIKTNSGMRNFYSKVQKSNIVYAQQPFPKGFGDAVMKARSLVGNESFFLHAGDNVILSTKNNHLRRLEKAFFKHRAEMAFFVSAVKDPRSYGVIQGKRMKDGIIRVENLEEKPEKPKSNLAVVAIYIFKPSIFVALEKTKPDKSGEIQLSDAMKKIIKNKKCVAIELTNDEQRIDFGNPESYVKCLYQSYQYYRT